MRVLKPWMVVLSTPSFALWFAIWSRFFSMREESGADRPGQREHEECHDGKGDWKEKALLHYGSSATGFPTFTCVMQGISALATAAL